MAIKSILKMGDPFLLRTAKRVEKFNTLELNTLIQDMHETMEAKDGAGLAAPQIGVNLQVIIFGLEHNPRYPDAERVPYTVLINPILTPLTKEVEEDWEGCLSVPNMRGRVPRFTKILYRGFDQYGESIDRSVDGFHARVVQHECDHLQGILYPMRINDLRMFGFVEALPINPI
ncbi:MAG: peptide deformylase [Nitrosomonadaceae bacterium]|nr:peptide deformylase [Nitrosomonadaceae bacterium]